MTFSFNGSHNLIATTPPETFSASFNQNLTAGVVAYSGSHVLTTATQLQVTFPVAASYLSVTVTAAATVEGVKLCTDESGASGTYAANIADQSPLMSQILIGNDGAAADTISRITIRNDDAASITVHVHAISND